MVKDRTPNMGSGEHLKGDAPAAVVQLGCPDQPQKAGLGEVLLRLLAVVGVMAGNGLHQVAVLDDTTVALANRGDAALRQA
jgi:hypothetical protein